jgi:hypothetical protein
MSYQNPNVTDAGNIFIADEEEVKKIVANMKGIQDQSVVKDF